MIRNRLINPDFAILASPTSGTSFTTFTSAVAVVKGWFVSQTAGGGTVPSLTVTRAPLPIDTVASLVEGEAPSYLQFAFADVGTSLGAGSFTKIFQQLAPRVLYGKHSIFSFWAKPSVAGFTLVFRARRSYGTGGTPSADRVFIEKAIPLKTVGWQRYAVDFATTLINDGVHAADVPGTNGDSSVFLEVFLQAPAGTFTNANLSAVPAIGNVQVIQPQLELAPGGSGPQSYSNDEDNSVLESVANTTKGSTVVNVTGTTATLAPNTAVYVNNASLATLTLPAASAVDDVIRIYGVGAGGWKVAQLADQTINNGNATATTTGTGGSIASAHRYNAVALRCVTANTLWTVESEIEAVTVV